MIKSSIKWIYLKKTFLINKSLLEKIKKEKKKINCPWNNVRGKGIEIVWQRQGKRKREKDCNAFYSISNLFQNPCGRPTDRQS